MAVKFGINTRGNVLKEKYRVQITKDEKVKKEKWRGEKGKVK